MADTGGQDSLPDHWGLVDKATGSIREKWWASQDDDQKLAWWGIFIAAAIGVLGVNLWELATTSEIPTSLHMAAALYLILITLPVAAAAAAFTLFVGRTTGAVLTFIAAGAAMAGVGAMTALMEAFREPLKEFYCYNDGTVLETACREFNMQAYEATPHGGSPALNLQLLAKVFVLTVDARGIVMVICGLVAGLCAGYLIKRKVA
jgi:hypothetical protein